MAVSKKSESPTNEVMPKILNSYFFNKSKV